MGFVPWSYRALCEAYTECIRELGSEAYSQDSYTSLVIPLATLITVLMEAKLKSQDPGLCPKPQRAAFP